MNWRNRRVLVTGGTGFLGSRLVNELSRANASVTCLIRDESYQSNRGYNAIRIPPEWFVRGDVRDQSLLERVLGEYEVETVFHLAAQTQVGVANANPVSTFETNVQGTVAVLEACRRSPKVKQVVVASSDKAYGEGLNKDENGVANPSHPYDVSKMCADVIAQTYARTWGLPVAITRCANLFGGGDLNWSRLVPGTIRSVLRGERPVLRGSGREVRDWLHVSDAVTGYVRLAEWMEPQPIATVVESLSSSEIDRIEKMFYERLQQPQPTTLGMTRQCEAFNFSLGVQVTSLEVVRSITQFAGKDVTPVIHGTAFGEISKQGLCSDKARRLLGWEPKVGLEEGLKEAVEWYRWHRGYV